MLLRISDQNRRVIREPTSPKEVMKEVDNAKKSKQPIEQIKPIFVEISVTKPPTIRRRSCELIHKRNQHRTEIEPKGIRAISDGSKERLHAAHERLLVEEFNESNCGEHLREAKDEELRCDVEDGEGFRIRVRVRGNVSSFGLDEGGDHHGEGGGEEAGTDATEGGDAGLVTSETTGEGEDEVVVEGDDEEEHHVRDGLEGGRWDG